jgi:hypothetical protein
LPERFELLLSQLDEQECGSSDRNRHRWLAGRLKEGLTSRPKCQTNARRALSGGPVLPLELVASSDPEDLNVFFAPIDSDRQWGRDWGSRSEQVVAAVNSVIQVLSPQEDVRRRHPLSLLWPNRSA